MQRARTRALTLLIAMLIAAVGSPALAGTQIVIGAAKTGPAGKVSAPISMKGAPNPSPVVAIQVDVLFPQAALSAPNCTAASGVPLAGTRLITGAANTPPGKGRLRLLFINTASLTPMGNGPLATCTFTAAPGTYNLSGMNLGVSDADGNLLDATICTGGCC